MVEMTHQLMRVHPRPAKTTMYVRTTIYDPFDALLDLEVQPPDLTVCARSQVLNRTASGDSP